MSFKRSVISMSDGKVRRARLYYLRGRQGKSAKIKEKIKHHKD
ncbi:LSU ribosomal protein L19p [Mariniradius saccharolyticus AK6]|uniref:Large ribosomal subunit protein bL19 n=1 Tax=Mariniradius saccharolyticus AK6 TaxID=1239962 RepID=M7X7M9_9BACT|nr:LSU ribosomal protein L19p [Mariniradius saccharolyticus AK6]